MQTMKHDRGLRASYDQEASQYDARRYESAEGQMFNDLELQVLQSWLPLRDGIKVLDIPAGTGRLSVALAALGATLVGTDISANMLGVAVSKGRRDPKLNVTFTQASGTDLPFADDTFDAVVSFKFFHLIPNDRKRHFIREMARVLKPGKPLIVEFNSPFYGGILAALRYYFRKKHPGGMRMKCLFPDQVGPLFDELQVIRTVGVKLPLAASIARLIGRHRMDRLNSWVGNLTGVKYLAYAIIVEARKPEY